MPGVPVTVLGYLEKCDGCGATALLAEPIQRPLFEWTCPACDGLIDGPPQPVPVQWERVYEALRELFDSLQSARQPDREGAVLDTVRALDDGDPAPGQLAPEQTTNDAAGQE